jgi:hypothetical protein
VAIGIEHKFFFVVDLLSLFGARDRRLRRGIFRTFRRFAAVRDGILRCESRLVDLDYLSPGKRLGLIEHLIISLRNLHLVHAGQVDLMVLRGNVQLHVRVYIGETAPAHDY